MNTITNSTWERTESGAWLVVECDGKLKTGPFESQEAAQQFFLEEFDEELSIEESST